jgi:hypothetical protein
MKKMVYLVVCLWASSLVAVPILNSTAEWGDSIASELSPMDDSAPATTINSATQSGEAVTIQFTGNGLGPAVRLGDDGAGFLGGDGDFGSLGPDLRVMFTLTAKTVVPNSLNLYFKTTTDVWNSNVILDLTGISINTPTTYAIAIGSESAWYRYSGSQAFADAFAAVTEFGFELVGGNYSQAQSYEFSEVSFNNTVPEPETVWMILVVLASLGITFRSRLLELGKQAVARIKA